MEVFGSAAFWWGLACGLVLGAAVTGLWLRAKLVELRAAKQLAEMQKETAESAAAKLGESFQALADSALRASQSAFLELASTTFEAARRQIAGDLTVKQAELGGLLRPLAETLEKLQARVREVEEARHNAFGALNEQLRRLSQETVTLAAALRNPQARGRWGELTLRRVVELAGMSGLCDFTEQESVSQGESRQRPDLVVRLPGNRAIAIDAKAPLTAFLEAAAATDENRRQAALKRHSQLVAEHVRTLSGKAYWSQLQPSPELVILFLPGEHFLDAALEQAPSLVEEALEKRVMLATPASLVAILKGLAFGWREVRLAENAEEIRRLAAEFLARLQVLHGHYSEAGAALSKAVEAYNRAVASWDARLLPALRRLHELGAGSGEPAEEGHPVRVLPLSPREPEVL